MYMHTYQKKCHINLIFTLNVHIEEKNENEFSYNSQST